MAQIFRRSKIYQEVNPYFEQSVMSRRVGKDANQFGLQSEWGNTHLTGRTNPDIPLDKFFIHSDSIQSRLVSPLRMADDGTAVAVQA